MLLLALTLHCPNVAGGSAHAVPLSINAAEPAVLKVLMNLIMIVSSSLILQKQRQYGQSARPASSPRRNRASFDPARRTTALTITLVLCAHVSGGQTKKTNHLRAGRPPAAAGRGRAAPRPGPGGRARGGGGAAQR